MAGVAAGFGSVFGTPIAGAVILGFGVIALISLLPLPWRAAGRALGL